ncbi:MAG: hypothetical protein WD042_04125 [Phycisphaeraceae bacterium]
MNLATSHAPFPLVKALAAITALGAVLLALAWLLVPHFFAGNAYALAAPIGAAVVWLTVSASLLGVAAAAPFGVMPTVYAWFIGMFLRMFVCLAAAWVVTGRGWVDGPPLAAALAIPYLPMLLAEAGFVGWHLWHRDASARGRQSSLPRRADATEVSA